MEKDFVWMEKEASNFFARLNKQNMFWRLQDWGPLNWIENYWNLVQIVIPNNKKIIDLMQVMHFVHFLR